MPTVDCPEAEALWDEVLAAWEDTELPMEEYSRLVRESMNTYAAHTQAGWERTFSTPNIMGSAVLEQYTA